MASVDKSQSAAAATAAGPGLRRLWPLLALAGLGVALYASGLHRYLSLEQLAIHRLELKDYIAGHFLLALLAYFVLYVLVVALSLPAGAALTLAGGLLFGWLAGGTTAVLAATLGASLVFAIAKSSLGGGLAAKAGPWLARLSEGFKQDALSYMLFLRLVPAFPFFVVNLAPALLGVPFRSFLLGTLLGIIPGTFAFAYLGTGLDSIIEAQQKAYAACMASAASTGADCHLTIDARALVTPELIIALCALAGVSLLPVLAKRLLQRGT